MSDIVMKSNENVCEDIGNKKKWTRTCPKCNKEICFSTKSNYTSSVNNNCLCKKCSNYLKHWQEKRKIKFESGEMIGQLIILNECSLDERPTNNNSCRYYECKCSCGNICKVMAKDLNRRHKISCGCLKKLAGTKNLKQWYKNGNVTSTRKFVGKISGAMWSHIQHGAKIRNITVEITKEYIWNLFLKQQGCCALTGIELKLSPLSKDYLNITASLDRIDSSKGYIEGNVQWLHKDVNLMKLYFPNEYFIKVCKLVSKNNK